MRSSADEVRMVTSKETLESPEASGKLPTRSRRPQQTIWRKGRGGGGDGREEVAEVEGGGAARGALNSTAFASRIQGT